MTSLSLNPTSLSLPFVRTRLPSMGGSPSRASPKSTEFPSSPFAPSSPALACSAPGTDYFQLFSSTPVNSSPQQHQQQHQPPQSSLEKSPASNSPPCTPRIARSRPITIQLPRRPCGPVCTPPEPLSARGDLPGGYFPLHEDVQRSYKPHPFDAAAAKNTGFSSVYSNSPTAEPESPIHGLAIAEPPFADHFRLVATSAAHSTSTSTSMTMTIPLGKYHPSNFKNKDKEKPAALPPLLTASSSTTNQSHRRSPSDVRKKLQQYQRDIVEQAAIAGGMPIPGAPKPLSPRLRPLGSPGIGPMTPMELEGEAAGYLVAGARAHADTTPQQEMVGKMIKAEGGIEQCESGNAGEPKPAQDRASGNAAH